jgi:hypothetical protein
MCHTLRARRCPIAVLLGLAAASLAISAPAQASSPLTAAHIRALLHKQLTPSGPQATTRAVLEQRGYSYSVKIPSSGQLVISWYLVTPSPHLARRKPHPVLVATGRARVRTSADVDVNVELTRHGMELLTRAPLVTLTAEGVFKPSGLAPIVALTSFSLGS